MNKSFLHKIDAHNHPLQIRWSTNQDIGKIHHWLIDEDKQGVHGNFLCNWSLTVQSHQEGKLLVLVDEIEGIPIAYQWGQLLHSGILQVRKEWRGKGLGRLIVEQCIELAAKQDEMVLQIECKPLSSIPFWKNMGFTIVEDKCEGNAKGYLVLTKTLILPSEGVTVKVKINSFPERRKWQENVSPTETFSLHAVQSTDGKLHLPKRAVFLDEKYLGNGDSVIEIIVDDKVVYCDKAKYADTQQRGVQLCTNGFFIDLITV